MRGVQTFQKGENTNDQKTFFFKCPTSLKQQKHGNIKHNMIPLHIY